MTNSLTTKALSAVLAVCATTVSFAEVASARTYEFSYAPTELADAESREQLDERVAEFARRACTDGSVLRTPRMKRECREEIAAQVESQIFGEKN